MRTGVELPTGGVDAGRSADVYNRPKTKLLKAALGLLACAQLTGVGIKSGVLDEGVHVALDKIPTQAVGYETDVAQKVITTDTTSPKKPRPQPTTTSTTTAPPEITTTTTLPPTTLPPQTTTTKLAPATVATNTQTICEQAITNLDRVPRPSGWVLVCEPPSKAFDGYSFPDRKVTELYKDPSDSLMHMEAVGAHEIGHEWLYQTVASEAVPAVDPVTGSFVLDAAGQPVYVAKYSDDRQEALADGFAYAFGYHEYGNAQTAQEMCGLLQENGVSIC
jgi:hypothetical protein